MALLWGHTWNMQIFKAQNFLYKLTQDKQKTHHHKESSDCLNKCIFKNVY